MTLSQMDQFNEIKDIANKLNFLNDPFPLSSQCPEKILSKMAKSFKKSYIGLKSMLQKFQIYISLNPRSEGVESTSSIANTA